MGYVLFLMLFPISQIFNMKSKYLNVTTFVLKDFVMGSSLVHVKKNVRWRRFHVNETTSIINERRFFN